MQTVALVYAIMESKTFEGYVAVFQKSKDIGYNFQNLMADYEDALMAAIRHVMFVFTILLFGFKTNCDEEIHFLCFSFRSGPDLTP